MPSTVFTDQSTVIEASWLNEVNTAVFTAQAGPSTQQSWAFNSLAGSFGTYYFGGFYIHSGTANDFSPSTTFGTANVAYGAHFFVVLGAATVDELTIRVTGTSMTNGATRTAADTEDIVIPSGSVVDTYYETANKWIGQVTVEAVSGTAKICDFGYCKYWDNNNTDFVVTGIEATWLAGANDAAPNISLIHHHGEDGNTDWTYTGSGATPETSATHIANMQTDYNTEYQLLSGIEGSWVHANISHSIPGSGKEGILWEIVTTANNAFNNGTLMTSITGAG
jgi:hypothetical protein